jgi:hypothetical protein
MDSEHRTPDQEKQFNTMPEGPSAVYGDDDSHLHVLAEDGVTQSQRTVAFQTADDAYAEQPSGPPVHADTAEAQDQRGAAGPGASTKGGSEGAVSMGPERSGEATPSLTDQAGAEDLPEGNIAPAPPSGSPPLHGSFQPERPHIAASQEADTRAERLGVRGSVDAEGPKTQVTQEVGENSGTVVGVLQQTVRRMVDSHRLPPEYVTSCVATFAKPPKIELARDKLQRRRVVVLVGEAGTGRHTSAIWLLNDIGGLTLHEVRREPRDGFAVDDLATEQRAGWLLDLRSEDDQVGMHFGRTLATSRELLEDTESYLAVAIRPQLWEQVGVGGHEVEVEWLPAAPQKIVELRLKRQLPDTSVTKWLNHPAIADRLGPLPPPEAAQWADTIRDEHFTSLDQERDVSVAKLPADEAFKVKVDNVLKARSSWRRDLLEWQKVHKDSRQRNFLLAAAVLENAPAADVFLAAESLAREFKEPHPEAPGQTGPGILELADDAKAHLPDGETLRFNRVGYADAVLEYFWADRMHLRQTFISWMSTLPLRYEGALAEAVVGRIGVYVLRWSVQHNNLHLLNTVVTAWADHEKLAPNAEALVTAAALDAVTGKAMRDQMLDWAKDERVPVQVKTVIARVCGGPLAAVYPKMMLLRLGYLARTAEPATADAVRDAMRSLWQVPELRRRIRAEIIEWCKTDQIARQDAGRRTFTALIRLGNGADGLPLLLFNPRTTQGVTLPDEERRFLVLGWRTILDRKQPDEDAIGAFAMWMDAALSSTAAQPAVLEIFTAAVHESDTEDFSGRRQVTLIKLAFAWQPVVDPSDTRTLLRDTLLERVATLDPVRHTADQGA